MNRKIIVSDITMTIAEGGAAAQALTFRQKIELAKLLERLGVSVIETGALKNGKQDELMVKSLASTIRNSTVCVTVDINNVSSIDNAVAALKDCRHKRLQVSMPVSTVQMEYVCHKKPSAMLALVGDFVKRCADVCDDVEFVAEDFGRSEQDFLTQVIDTAVENGATTISVYDTAGVLFDYEFFNQISELRKHLPESVKLGVRCSNEMYMADNCAIAAVRAGVDEIKTTSYGSVTTSLKRFVKILTLRTDVCMVQCDVKQIEMARILQQIKNLCEVDRKKPLSSLDGAENEEQELQLSLNDDIHSVLKVAQQLGYELNDEDGQNVYKAFLSLASKNEVVSMKELDAIIASVAFQVPQTYKLENYIINSGNVITSTCHLILRKGEEVLEGVSIGDGPIDAAFITIGKLIGGQYELDDFQIRSVSEGSKAMGEAIVRLRYEGKVYSGRGISRDIVASSIMAYLSAVNKIVYEEVDA